MTNASAWDATLPDESISLSGYLSHLRRPNRNRRVPARKTQAGLLARSDQAVGAATGYRRPCTYAGCFSLAVPIVLSSAGSRKDFCSAPAPLAPTFLIMSSSTFLSGVKRGWCESLYG